MKFIFQKRVRTECVFFFQMNNVTGFLVITDEPTRCLVEPCWNFQKKLLRDYEYR